MGCLAALAVLCGALGDAPSRGKSPVPAPSGDPGAEGHPRSLGRRGLFVGAAVALGCEQVPALSPLKESGLLRPGVPQLGLGKEAGICSCRAWQQVRDTTTRLSFHFMLILLKIAGKGCPVVVSRCFAEAFVDFWSHTCLYKYIYAHIYTYICQCMYACVYFCACNKPLTLPG